MATRHPLPYVLIAESDVPQAAAYLELVKPFRLGALLARDGDEAMTILHRFGIPALLVCDLALPRRDAFDVMELLRRLDPGHAAIIATSSFSALRASAERRLDLGINAILSPSAGLDQWQAAIQEALRPRDDELQLQVKSVREASAIMRDAADEALRLTRAPGAAVYVKDGADEMFRAQVTWSSDRGSRSPLATPAVYDWVMEHCEALVLPDLSSQSAMAETSDTRIRGTIAVPIRRGGGNVTIGALCVFDVRPLTLGADDLDALKALGVRVGRQLSNARR